MKRPSGRRCFGWFIAGSIIYILFCLLGVQIDKTTDELDLVESSEWVRTGKSWLDRQACRWLGLCGTIHLVMTSAWTSSNIKDGPSDPIVPDPDDWWLSGDEDPDSWSKEERKRREVPQYVLDHAPYVHLFSGEQFWPCDVGEHLLHTKPYVNYTDISNVTTDRNLTNLDRLNDYHHGQHGRYMYLQSDDNPEERPNWLVGSDNIPHMPEPIEDDGDAPWPNLDDLKHLDLETMKKEALENAYGKQPPSGTESARELPTGLVTSQDGRCGGNSGQTCKGSHFGSCCSIYGWCGNTDEFCGEPCDPLSGTCYDPYNPPRGPHTDLRKRSTLDLNGERHKPEPGGRSSAPAILIVVPKENGIVDAFWFFFYSFNLGQTVLNIRFGNHVGDWEHTCVRFRNGKPIEISLSEHNFGQAFTWKAMEKYIPSHDGSGTMIGSWSNETAGRMAKRPVVYSAIGSHAMYGTPGLHPYIIPFGLLHDETDRGPLWDPAQNFQAYTYDPTSRTMRASTLNPSSPTGWLNYAGHWGDKYYPLSDPRQYRFAGQYHYVNGPTGPRFKNLGRSKVCQRRGTCDVRHWLSGSKPATETPPEEDIEDGGLPGGNQTDDSSSESGPSFSEDVFDEGKEGYSMWTR
jgi:hypothetical protein